MCRSFFMSFLRPFPSLFLNCRTRFPTDARLYSSNNPSNRSFGVILQSLHKNTIFS